MLQGLPIPLFADLAASPPPLVMIDDVTASDDAQVDISWDLDFELVHVLINNVRPVTPGVRFYARSSSDGGSTFDSGATDYRTLSTAFGTSAAGFASNGISELSLTDDANTMSATANGAYLVTVRRPFDAGLYTAIQHWGGHMTGVGGVVCISGFGWRNVAGRVDALRFFMSSGNIDAGRFFAWGVQS